MNRRRLLKGMAATVALQPAFAKVAARAASSGFSRVRPGDPAWPSPERWAKLKEAVRGALTTVEPPFADCAAGPKGAACADALANMHNPFFIGDQPGGTEVSGWLDAWTPAP